MGESLLGSTDIKTNCTFSFADFFNREISDLKLAIAAGHISGQLVKPNVKTVHFPLSSEEGMFLPVESINSKRRMTVVWERGCPRGCTFCSHNGMSRIDMQNILGKGDRKKGELIVRDIDKESETFSLPARWPTPRYAVDNVKMLYEKYQIDVLMISDENMTSNLKWTKEFCNLYKEEGLDEIIKWGTLGDAPSVATKPEIVKTMRDAGCSYISFGFESASNKVLNEDIKKGQTQEHLQKTINAIRGSELTPIATFMIGNAHENINDLMETVTFWMRNNITVNPFICTPYVGSPIFYEHKDKILEQYDERIKILKQDEEKNKTILQKKSDHPLDKHPVISESPLFLGVS